MKNKLSLFTLGLVVLLIPAFYTLSQNSNPGAWTFNHNHHLYVSADQSFSADTSLHNINGLSLALPSVPSPLFLTVECRLYNSQATAGAANPYGVQFVTNAPTNSIWYAQAQTSLAATGVFAATAPATITGTSATTLTTATPAAISTVYGIILHGFIEWPANTSGTLNIMAGTGNTSDANTIKRDSNCFLPGQ